MSHFRYNKLKDNWVIISPKRVRRPLDFEVSFAEAYDKESPFVYGNEHKTPPEIYAVREYGSKKDSPGWSVRVVPNKYNALDIEKNPISDFDGVFERIDGCGAHEIIIDTPKFPSKFEDLSEAEIALVFRAAKDRVSDLQRDGRIKHISVFKNQGVLAGATLSHPHTQILAMPFIPKNIMTEITQSRKHYETTGRSLVVDMVTAEIRFKNRVIEESDNFLLFCPYASFLPFEMMICAKKSTKDFMFTSDSEIGELSKLVLSALKRVTMALRGVSYNLFLKTVPPKREARTPDFYHKLDEFYQWHIEIVPRIPVIGGFELSSGMYVNTVTPEDSANFLRDLNVT